MKSCTQCLKEKDISAFIDKRNGTETLLKHIQQLN